jgi:diaminohydroxyphosphoribosylaminopyrimidine deaminase/5-amino-6-(5-phosphoribosylamino)uracil reductase
MVGRNTAQYDNPELTVREWDGKNPVRVVLDPNLRLKNDLKLFDGSVRTVCYNLKKNHTETNIEYIQVTEGRFLEELLEDLYSRNIQSLLVEGGARLISSLLEAGYWHEARVFTSGKEFGEGVKAPLVPTHFSTERLISGDNYRTYFNPITGLK